MASRATSKPRRTRAAGGAKGARPPSLQVGALCWRLSGKGLRILLITSRDTGRWVIPKGWPMKKRAVWDAAAREAWEEAGVQGVIGRQSIGLYTYRKMLPGGAYIPCAVRVFPLEVQSMRREYPETAQRSSKWFSPRKASRQVDEPELAMLLRGFEPRTAGTPPSPPEPEPEA
jgi:8-oxo-dGTP pyrophosphatase MutT (NUDIX family)